MSVDVRALAIRFADLWAVDPHQMADEIYAPGIVMERMADPRRPITGRQELHAVEDRLAAMIPEHRHELVRVLVDGQRACLETTVVAPLSHEYAPACVWWWVDDSGEVSHEVGWFDWEQRRTDSGLVHGTVPPPVRGVQRSREDWNRIAEAYARSWREEPAAGLEQFSAAVTAAAVGAGEVRGRDALLRERERELPDVPLSERRLDLHQVLGEGSSLALLVVMGDGERATRGTIVLSFDADGLIVGERRYLSWAKAVPWSLLDRPDVVGHPRWSPG